MQTDGVFSLRELRTWNPGPKQIVLLKFVAFTFALLPFLRLFLFALADRLGANPIEAITQATGDWTLYFLCLTLAITPLRRLSGWNWLIKLRRMLGLFAFFYGSLHFLAFLWFDHFFELSEMLKDAVKRPFITVGFVAFVLMIPLALTSTNAMIRRLGGHRWQWLHRANYFIAPLGVLHFWWMKAGKNDFAEPSLFALIVLVLLAVRVGWKLAQKRHVKPIPN